MAKILNVAAVNGMVMERGEESPREAMIQFEEAVKRLDGTGVDLVVTCETMMMNQPAGTGEDPENPGEILSAYSDFARRNRCVVAGAARTIVNGEPRQSILYYGHNGELLGMYHKMFPTPQAIAKGTVPGDGANIVETPVGKLGGILCFDLNFDELRDGYIGLAPDILCFSSYYNGGAPVQANWALRTHAFMVSALKDGCSEIYDPLGRLINSSTYYGRIAWARINTDRFVMHGGGNSAKFPDIRRKYKDEVFIDSDTLSAQTVLYSYSEERTAKEIAEEFELVSFEDYINSSRKLRSDKLAERK